MEWVRIGVVVYYYSTLKIAIVELEGKLEVGDWIGFTRRDEMMFEQEVTAIQIDGEDMISADANEKIDLNVENRIQSDSVVYKLK